MLDDDAIARYARQIVVPGIGAAGQEKLLAATVMVAGHPRGAAQARLYLEAAGLRVVDAPGPSVDVIVLAGTASVAPALRSSLAAGSVRVCWYEAGGDGFTAGVHPAAPLPCTPSAAAAGDGDDAVHDAAACDAAGLACAIVLGLAHREGPDRFEL